MESSSADPSCPVGNLLRDKFRKHTNVQKVRQILKKDMRLLLRVISCMSNILLERHSFQEDIRKEPLASLSLLQKSAAAKMAFANVIEILSIGTVELCTDIATILKNCLGAQC